MQDFKYTVATDKYVHLVLYSDSQGFPRHSSIMVSDKPYDDKSLQSYWTFPKRLPDNGKDAYESDCAMYARNACIKVCLGPISANKYLSLKEEIDASFTTDDLGRNSTFKGKSFRPWYNCVDVAKEILTTFFPGDARIFQDPYTLLPNSFTDKVYQHIQQKEFNPADRNLILPINGCFNCAEPTTAEEKASSNEIWKVARFLYKDRLLRKRNVILYAILIGLIMPLTLSSYFLGDKMPAPLSPDSMSNTEAWALLGTIAAVSLMILVIAGTSWQKSKNPYNQEEPVYQPASLTKSTGYQSLGGYQTLEDEDEDGAEAELRRYH